MKRAWARAGSHLFAASLLAAAGAASAQAPDCKNAMSTLEINACAAAQQQAVESKLNETYQRVLKTLGDKEHAASRDKLVAAQRLWVKFREADCAAVYEKWSGGSVRNEMFSECMQKHAKRRIEDLDDLGTLY